MIISLENPLVKRIVALRDKTDRQREGVFLIEGEKELLRALANGFSVETLMYCAELLAGNEELTTTEHVERELRKENARGAKVIGVSPKVYAKIAYRDKAEGLVAVAHIPQRDINDSKIPENPFILVVQGIEKPGNLGALLRTADGVGVSAVIVCDSRVDLYNPNVVRSSMGAVFTVPTYEMPLEKALHWLGEKKIKVVLTSPQASKEYTQLDYTGPVAVVLGSEAQGLSDLLLEQDITQVKIPMAGQMDSLNVSCSGAIMLYEVLRQRKNRNM